MANQVSALELEARAWLVRVKRLLSEGTRAENARLREQWEQHSCALDTIVQHLRRDLRRARRQLARRKGG